MADDKKKSAPAPSPFNKNHFNETMLMLVIIFLLSFVLVRFNSYLGSLEGASLETFWSKIRIFFSWLWDLWQGIAIFLVVLGFGVGAYSKFKEKQIGHLDEKIYGAPEGEVVSGEVFEEKRGNEKWEKILAHINSENPADWRLAIIEADIMLDELLRASGYHGETVGDLLKSVEPSDMLTLDNAWEAHKVRNRIAHSGSDFDLNEREAKRVIGLFESVFREFEII